MKITRTANAGILLALDGVTVLLDGICREAPPYAATPPWMLGQLLRQPPDALAVTHTHEDHFDAAFALRFRNETLRPVIGPEGLPVPGATARPVRVGPVRVTPIPSRHIGKAGADTAHVSFLIEGTKRVFFTGDASPLFWDVPGGAAMPKADVLAAAYAYASTEAGWRRAKSSGAADIVLLHLPEPEKDTLGLWDAVRRVTGMPKRLQIPAVGETLTLAQD